MLRTPEVEVRGRIESGPPSMTLFSLHARLPLLVWVLLEIAK